MGPLLPGWGRWMPPAPQPTSSALPKPMLGWSSLGPCRLFICTDMCESEGPETGMLLKHLGCIEGWHHFRFRTAYRVHFMGPTLQRRGLMSEMEK